MFLTFYQEQLGFILDFKSIFEDDFKLWEVGLKIWDYLPRTARITTYKTFIRPHLDYGDFRCNQTFNNLFKEKLEPTQ